MFRVFTVLVVLGAAIGAWWWWLPPERAPHSRGEAATADPASATPAGERANLDAEEPLDGFDDQVFERDLLTRVEVVDRAGRPVSGARVEAFVHEYGSADDRLAATSITDDSGVARFEPLPADKVRVRRVGYSVLESDVSKSTKRITLNRALSVRGRATALGAPAAGAVIRVWDKDEDSEPIDFAQVTDADGAFTLTGIRKLHPYILIASYSNYASVVLELSKPRELQVVFGNGLTLTGNVVDGSGNPIAAEIVIAPLGARSPFGDKLFPYGSRRRELDAMARPPCGEDGRFSVRGLRPDAYDVYARTSAGVGTTRVVLRDDANAVVRVLTTATLVMSTFGIDGESVDGDTVSVYRREQWERGRNGTAFELQPGHYRIAANAKGHVGRTQTVDLEPGETRYVNMKLDRGFSVSGRVLDESGSPLKGIWVGVRPETDREPWPRTKSSHSDADGKWTVSGLAPGKGVLRYVDEAYYEHSEAIHVSEGARFEVRLTSRGKITGRFLTAPDEALLMVLFRYANGGSWNIAEIGKRGTFAIDDPGVQGPLTITLLPRGLTPVVFRDIVLKRGATHDLGDIAPVKAVPLHVTVLDAEGEPIEAALVEIRSPRFVPGLRTDKRGFLEVANQPNTLDMRVVADGHAATYRTVDASKAVTIRLEHGVNVRGTIADPAGKPVASAYVVFWKANADGSASEFESWRAEVNGFGEIKVRLARGKYRVRVYGKNRQWLPETFTVTDDARFELRMR